MPVLNCLVCAEVLPKAGRRRDPGRPRLYCGSVCRQRAYRYRDDPELAEILKALKSGRLKHDGSKG